MLYTYFNNPKKLSESNMSFDIRKYCHIGNVVSYKGKEPLKYEGNGLNLFLVVKGSCSADSHGTMLEVKKEEIVCCDGQITIYPGETVKSGVSPSLA